MKKPPSKLYNLTLPAAVAALLCIAGPYTAALPFSPIPLSLTSFWVALAAISFGTEIGTLGCVLYLLIGSVGLPVFSGFSGGFGILLGPTGGYLAGYLPLAYSCALFSQRFPGHSGTDKAGLAAGVFLGQLLLYLLGSIWLARIGEISFYSALTIGAVPFIPGDILKSFFAVILGSEIRVRLRRAKLFR